MEKDVNELKDVDNSTKVISTIKSEVLNFVKEYLGSSLGNALHKAKSTETSKGTSQGTSKSQPKSIGKSAQADEIVLWLEILKGYRILEKKRVTLMNYLLSMLIQTIGSRNQKTLLLQILSGMKLNQSYVELDYNKEERYKALIDQLDWNNLKGDRYPLDLSKPLPLVMSGNHQIVMVDYFFNNDLAYLQRGSTDRTYTTSLTKTKALYTRVSKDKDSMDMLLTNRLFNLRGDVIVHLAAASPYSNPQGFIYVDKLGRNRLMCSHELYKLSDGTLISLRDTLKYMANNLEMVYTSVMPRKRWSNLDKKRSHIMIKDIDGQLL
nr:hypothetical protein [Tanacetum cinerariifolium]